MKKAFNFTIGADPEFNLILQNRKVSAQDSMDAIFNTDEELKRKESSSGSGYQYKEAGNIGWDAHSSTGEIRPVQANTIEKLTENIETLLKKLHEKMPLINISTLSYFSAVGGHIHLSVPQDLATNTKLGNIHKKLASFYLPIMLSESKINLQLRLKTSYGKLSDYRIETRGGIPVYEFRVPSAEWLTTKRTTQGTLAYIATIYNELINHPKHAKEYDDIIYRNEKQATALQELAISDYKLLSEQLYERITKFIKECEFYPEYKEEIDYILNPKLALEDKKNCKYNIIKGWKLGDDKPKPNKKDILNDKKVNELARKFNIDALSGIINVTYNDDTNVAVFAQEFAKRVNVFDWNPKNFYFLFGLRKGIENFLTFDMEENVYEGIEMIKTEGDINATKKLYKRMRDKFISVFPSQYNGTETAEYLNALFENEGETQGKNYIIGIPYEMRLKGNSKPFLELIYDLEKKKEQKGTKISSIKAITQDKELEQGTIEKATMVDANKDKITFSSDNTSRTIQDTITIAAEIQRERRTWEEMNAEPARNLEQAPIERQNLDWINLPNTPIEGDEEISEDDE